MSKLKNRGKEGSDDRLFGMPIAQRKIREAVKDLSYLLGRGFAEKSSLSLVGNRYKLTSRQQKAVQGMSEGAAQLIKRRRKCLTAKEVKNRDLLLDGFNVLILLESVLSGGYVFKGLDGCYRDLSSVHGTYRKVQQTDRAIEIIATFYEINQLKSITWVFDKPVSNSGRLKTMISDLARERKYNWEVLLDNNPDKLLAASDKIVVTSDAWILNEAAQWFNLVGFLVENYLDEIAVVPAIEKNEN